MKREVPYPSPLPPQVCLACRGPRRQSCGHPSVHDHAPSNSGPAGRPSGLGNYTQDPSEEVDCRKDTCVGPEAAGPAWAGALGSQAPRCAAGWGWGQGWACTEGSQMEDGGQIWFPPQKPRKGHFALEGS